MSQALTEGFFLRFPANPRDPISGLSHAPYEVGATLTMDGKPTAGLIHTISPDEGAVPRGQGMIVDLTCPDRFLVSYDVTDWGRLSAKEKLHCICLDVNLRCQHLGDLLADFRSLLQPLKKRLTLNASNGKEIRSRSNRDLISSFKTALKPNLSNKKKRHRGAEIDRWFQAYDLSHWGMPFKEALKQHGYRGAATVADNKGLRPTEIAQQMFPMQMARASRKELSDEASLKLRELARKYCQAPSNLMHIRLFQQGTRCCGHA